MNNKTVKFLVGLILINLCAANITADEPTVKSTVFFKQDSLFVGEKPVVMVSIKNTGREAIAVVKDEERAFRRMLYSFGVVQEPIDRGPHERNERQPWKRPDDYIFLEAGDTKIYRIDSQNAPVKDGNCVVRLRFNPLTEKNFEIVAENIVTTYKLTKNDIISQHRIKYSGSTGTEYIDFINAITKAGNELIFRRSRSSGELIAIKRLEVIKDNTRFLAVPVITYQSNSRDNIMLMYNLRGVIFVLVVDNKGNIVDKKRVDSKNGELNFKNIEDKWK